MKKELKKVPDNGRKSGRRRHGGAGIFLGGVLGLSLWLATGAGPQEPSQGKPDLPPGSGIEALQETAKQEERERRHAQAAAEAEKMGDLVLPEEREGPAPALEAVGDHAWVYHGQEGRQVNSLVLEAADSLLVVDTQFEDANNKAMIAALQQRFPAKPVRTLYLSHAHLDHVLGVAFFRRAYPEVEVVMLAGQEKHLQAAAEVAWAEYLASGEVGEKPELSLEDLPRPDRTKPGPFDVGFSGQKAYFDLVGAAESWRSWVVRLPASRAVFAGDLYRGDLVVDHRLGGTLYGWRAQLERLLEKDFTLVVPGHGPELASRAQLERFAEGLDILISVAEDLVDDGAALEAFLAADLPQQIPFFSDREASLAAIYREVVEKRQKVRR